MAGVSLFPSVSVDEALAIARTIAEHNAAQPMRRLDIFHQLGRAPDSGPSRTLVTASSGYGLTTGGYQAETVTLTERGRRATVDGDRAALVDAVIGVELFKRFFARYANAAFPSEVPAKSFLADAGVPHERLEACLDVIRRSGEAVGLIQERSGAMRVLSEEAAKEGTGSQVSQTRPEITDAIVPRRKADAIGLASNGGLALPSININLEIHLPQDAAPETYTAIFKGIREELLTPSGSD